MSARGVWRQIGEAGVWGNTLAGTVVGDRVVTLERAGALYATDPATGVWAQVSRESYASTSFLAGASRRLYTIDSSGTLYATRISDGSWQEVGDPAAYVNTALVTAVGDRVISLESSGAIYVTDPDGTWRSVGTGYASTRFLFGGSRAFFAIDKGTLYRISHEDGNYRQLGDTGAFVNTVMGAGMNDMVYTLEPDGFLWETDGNTGRCQKLSAETYLNTRLMFAGLGEVFTIETTGTMYATGV
jgi:hypothetical protein